MKSDDIEAALWLGALLAGLAAGPRRWPPPRPRPSVRWLGPWRYDRRGGVWSRDGVRTDGACVSKALWLAQFDPRRPDGD